jgi:hypothetical protein
MGGTKTTTTTITRTVTTQANPGPLDQTSNARYFGTPVAPATQLDARRYQLVIKPQFFLVGVTANVVNAAQQQNACAPLECPGVDDDHVVIPAGSQNLLFILPATTKGTVITTGKGAMKNTTITGAQLAAIVGGAKTPKLIEGLESGLWLTVDGDTVTSFSQQFQP